MADDDEDDFDDDDDDDDSGGRKDRDTTDRSRPRSRAASFVSRLVEGVMSVPALTLGQKIGTDSESLVKLLDKVETVIGPMLTGVLITSVGSFTRMPRSLRRALSERGVPRPLLNVLDRLFEDVFEGIWAARRMRHAAKTEPLTKEDVSAGFKKAREKIEEKVDQERTSLMTALGKADPAKRARFLTKVAGLSEEDKKRFEHYRPLVAKEAWLIEELADKDTSEWFPLLTAVLGEPPKEKIEKGVVQTARELFQGAGKALKAADDAVVDAIKPPDVGPDPVDEALKDASRWLRRRRGQ